MALFLNKGLRVGLPLTLIFASGCQNRGMETVLSSVPNALAMAVAQEATAIPEMLEDSAAQSEIEPIESASAASGESEDALDEESARLTDAALTG